MNQPRTIPDGFISAGTHPDGTPMYRKADRKPIGEGDKDAIAITQEEMRKKLTAMADKAKPKTRLRQSSKPLLNKTEQRFFDYLKTKHPEDSIRAKPMTFQLCNGVVFKPDVSRYAKEQCRYHMFDVKGPQQIQDDAAVKIKMAAKEWPEVSWWLAWETALNVWQVQLILP